MLLTVVSALINRLYRKSVAKQVKPRVMSILRYQGRSSQVRLQTWSKSTKGIGGFNGIKVSWLIFSFDIGKIVDRVL